MGLQGAVPAPTSRTFVSEDKPSIALAICRHFMRSSWDPPWERWMVWKWNKWMMKNEKVQQQPGHQNSGLHSKDEKQWILPLFREVPKVLLNKSMPLPSGWEVSTCSWIFTNQYKPQSYDHMALPASALIPPAVCDSGSLSELPQGVSNLANSRAQ